MENNRYWMVIELLLSYSTIVFAQISSKATITGMVVDASSHRPIEFVNVVVQSKFDSTLVTGATTGKRGKFEIKNIPVGEYSLRLGLIGFKEKTISSLRIKDQDSTIDLGTISLIETTVNLGEVLITSQKELFNNSIDRKVYNVDQDIMSKSGSASELLQNVPSIEVDIDGNVSLRGSSNVLILINGKNSPLMGKSRAEVLQQMPASSIEKIEVITNPSAKYKPDGTAGIINLVLKKNTSIGLNGGMTLNVGNDSRRNGNIRLNYNPGDFNIFASYSVRRDSRNRTTVDTRTQFDTSTSYYREDLISNARPLSHMVATGMEYNFDTLNSAGISGNYFYNGFTRDDVSNKILQNSSRVTINDYGRDRHDEEFEKEYGLTFHLQHNFPKEDHKVRVEFSASRAPEVEDNHFTNLFRLPPGPSTYDNTLIKQTETKNQLSIDYSDPIDKKSSLEAGYAGEFNNSDFDFYGEFFDTNQQAFVKDFVKTNRFLFDETIHALYATYELSFGSLGILGGVRTEQAYIRSNLVTQDLVVTNNYFSIYPTLHSSYKFSEFVELQLNYSRRVHRPDGEDLNPFPEYRDARNISSGNPNLLPEFIHSVEFGCKFQNDEISVLPGIYYRNTRNRITSITQVINDSTLLTTKQNLSTDQSTGVEFLVSITVGDLLTAHANANAYYNQIDASNLGYSSKRSTWAESGAFTFNVNVTRSTMLQVNSNFTSSRLTPQGENRPSYVINLGLRQELLSNKISLIATVADLFKTQKRELELNTPLLNQNVINKRDSRIIYFGLTYHFGTPAKKSNEESLHYDDSM